MEIKVVGIDLAKNVFELFGVNQAGKAVYRRRVRHEKLMEAIAQLSLCVIGIEACTGAFYWQREFERFGHTVKVISPQYVKPFVKTQKKDSNDAEAICIAIQQPRMRFVPCKTVDQQDIQALHRARQRLVNHRTALVCQIRGLLLDRGIAIGMGITRVRQMIPLILEDAENGLREWMRETANGGSRMSESPSSPGNLTEWPLSDAKGPSFFLSAVSRAATRLVLTLVTRDG